jgi:acid phosphatase
MRRARAFGWALAFLVAASAGCSAPARSDAPAAVPSLAEAKRRVVDYVGSGRYDTDVASAVAEAKAYLERRLGAGGKLAIVLDIDETSLSNLPSLRANDYGFIVAGPCDLPRGPCGFLAWIEMARAEPIRPVLGLVRFAREHGVAVFFITGRPERFRAATERNLREAGYEWTGVVLKPDDLTVTSAADFKAPARRNIVDQGYTIVVNIGDQMSDLDGGHAERTFKLPNPFYFVR